MKVTEEDKIIFSNTCRKKSTCDNCGGWQMYLCEDYAELGHNTDEDKPIRALIHKCANCKHVDLFVLD